jgi:hypothetical protein
MEIESLRDSTEEFATNFFLACFFVSEETITCGDDTHAASVEILADVSEANVGTTTWSGDTLEFEGWAVGTEHYNNFLLDALTFCGYLSEVALSLEEFADGLLDPRPWSAAFAASTVLRVAHAGQEVADGICKWHEREKS